jgi:hypothetical protein
VIVFIPRSGDGCKPGNGGSEWLPRRCQACGEVAIIGHGRRRRQAREGWPLEPERTRAVLEKIVAAGVPLEKYVGGRVCYGIKTGLNEAFEIDEAARKRMIGEVRACADPIKPFLGGTGYPPLLDAR